MEYLYYSVEHGFDEDDEPFRVYAHEKGMNDPNPETIYDEELEKDVAVKRWFDGAPAIIMPNTNYGYQGKYKNFYDKKREASHRRQSTGLSIPEIAKSADLSYYEESKNPITGKNERVKKYISDSLVPSENWEKMSNSSRKTAESLGILPQKYYQSPGRITPNKRTKIK